MIGDPLEENGPEPGEQGGESVLELHRAQLRERPDPAEGNERVPWWLWVTAVVAVFVSGYYLGRYNPGFSAEPHQQAHRSEAAPGDATGAAPPPANPAADLAREGQSVFSTNCAACHNATGAGLPGVFPPLAGSPWVAGSDTVVVKIVLLGLQGAVDVGGTTYKGQMPAWRAALSDRQIAAVVTYIRSSWGNKASAVPEGFVAGLRQALGQRSTPWTEAELRPAAGT